MKKFTIFFSLLVTFFLGSAVLGQDVEDQRFGEYIRMNESQRVTAFVAENPAMQAALMKRNIASKAPHLGLNQSQITFLRQIFPQIKAEVFTPGAARDEFLQMLNIQVPILFRSVEQVNALFIPSFIGKGVDQTVFFGNIKYVLRPVRPDENGACYCNNNYGCDRGYSCASGYAQCEPTTTGCGLMGGSACYGGCKYNGDLEASLRLSDTGYMILAI